MTSDHEALTATITTGVTRAIKAAREVASIANLFPHAARDAVSRLRLNAAEVEASTSDHAISANCRFAFALADYIQTAIDDAETPK